MSQSRELDPSESALSYFGSELRRLRQFAGLSQAELAEMLYCAKSLVSFIEKAERMPSRDFAERADRVFHTDGYLARMWPLINRSKYPKWFGAYVDLEASATAIRSYEPHVVDGLFQTEEYARAVLAAERHTNLNDLVAGRIERQGILDRDEPPYLSLVLDESVLRRPVGGAEVMRSQLASLLAASQRSCVQLQVLPLSAVHAHSILGGSLTIFSFSDGPDVAYTGGYGRDDLIGTVQDVLQCRVRYDRACADALSTETSRELIASLLEEPNPWIARYRT